MEEWELDSQKHGSKIVQTTLESYQVVDREFESIKTKSLLLRAETLYLSLLNDARMDRTQEESELLTIT